MSEQSVILPDEHQFLRDGDENVTSLVAEALFTVYDPEIPTLSVRDLGMVNRIHESDGAVTIYMTPTFMGCPALHIIRANMEKAVQKVEGVKSASVVFEHNPPWTTERISATGKARLKEFGIAPPSCSLLKMKHFAVNCPYCGSEDTILENLFGPTACRSLYHCSNCKQPFEAMKPV